MAIQKNIKKTILKNPVEEFLNRSNEADVESIELLKEHSKKLNDFKHSYKENNNEIQRISRKIGEAKKNNTSYENLLINIQKHSKTSKEISSNIKSVEDTILSFFPESLLNNSKNNKKTPNIKSRSYVLNTINMNDISISTLKNEYEKWNNYVYSNPNAPIYYKHEWNELIKNIFGHTGIYLYAEGKNNNILGILPLIHLKSRLFGSYLVSMPYFNHGGAIADHPDIEKALMTKADSYLKKLNCTHIEYRDDIIREGYPVKTEKVNMILSLPNSTEELWGNFSSKLRAQVKRSERENIDVSFGGLEYIDDFYNVFSHNMRDLGTPVYSKSFFIRILETFPEQSKLIIIKHNKEAVSAAFLIGYNDTLEIPWASTIKKVNNLSINMLLYWNVLKFSVKNKYSYFDFGRSSKNTGTYNFKKQWGAKPKQLYWHYTLAEKEEMPALNPSNPKYALIIKIWKKLPILVTRLIGPFIVKNLP